MFKRSSKICVSILSITPLVHPLVGLFIVLHPLAFFGGDGSGYAGLISYRVSILGQSISSPMMESLSRLSSALVAIYITQLSMSALGVRKPLWAFTSSILGVLSAGYLNGLMHIFSVFITAATQSISHTTSAGAIVFREVAVEYTAAYYAAKLMLPLITSMVSAVSSIVRWNL